MTNRIQKYVAVVLFIIGLFIFNGCSTEKTGWAHATYHSILTRFNGYFNAKEIMLEAEMKIDQSLPDEYMKRLPVYKEIPDTQVDLVASDMDIVIEKCAKVIRKNSIKKRGKEYTHWIDDCYLLMGKAYYYKKDYSKSLVALNQAAKRYPNENARFEAKLWLARLYSQQENNEKALTILSLLESDQETPEYLKMDIHKMYASIFISENNMESAIPELQRAISLAKRKNDRLRLTYLHGQILKEQDERMESMKVFALVLKMHPEYKMEFYTRIQMAMAYSVGSGDAESVRKELNKMLKDEKYIEFQDQIYYALAEMAYSERDIPKTLEYLHLSTKVSSGNDNQKATSFLRLGQIYFKEPKYQLAQANYDSCVSYMPEDFPNADEIRNLSNNLKDLVAQILIIENEDSLQMVAKMSPSQRQALIEDIIKERQHEEEQKKLQQQLQAEAQALQSTTDGTSPGAGPGGFGGVPGATTKWYFYNLTTRDAGASEFARKWGRRKNEDNWRRSSKEQTFDDVEEAASQNEGAGFFVDDNGDTMKVSGDWQNPNYYLKDLPITEEQILASNGRIIEAYYNLSIIYKEQMDDVPMSIETLEELNNRFNPNVHTADSYYRLYRMNLDLEENDRATYYRNKILNEFPESQYAKIIKDPNYLERENEEFQRATALYQQAYIKYFQRGYYTQTIESCNQILKDYSHTAIKPKATFLRALAIGHNNGESALRQELKAIINQFPDSEYADKATEILAGLDIKDEEAKAQAQKAAEEQKMQAEASEMNYEYDPESKHNFVILVKASGKALSEIKSTIVDFNRKNFGSEGLKMSAVVYQKGVQMISIKSFNSAQTAMNYQKMFENSGSLATIVADNPNYFIVSFTNYALFFKDKDHEKYKVWAEVKYKGL